MPKRVHYLCVDMVCRHWSSKGRYCGGKRPVYTVRCRPGTGTWPKSRRRALDKLYRTTEDAGAVTCLNCIKHLAVVVEAGLQ